MGYAVAEAPSALPGATPSIWLALAVAAALAGAAGQSAGQVRTFCSEPVTPFCVNSAGTFEDKIAQERCAGELRAYIDKLDRYVACLAEQQREAQGRAAQMQARFDCMARGEQDCR